MMTPPSIELEKLEKRTPLYDNHVDRGARMVDFAGWQMPLQYTKVLEEHQAVREACGLFDVSHMGLITLSSPDPEPAASVASFLDHLVPQDISKLYPGKAVYTQFLNESGGIIDDIIVYRLPDDTKHFQPFQPFLVIVNASNTQTDLTWLKCHAASQLAMTLQSPEYSLLSLQGPRFAEVLNRFDILPEQLPKRFHLAEYQIGSYPVLLARTGYTGEDGVEIIVHRHHVVDLWNTLLTKGEPIGLRPIGLAARDTLRLESAYPLHGHDITEQDSPLEAGLEWSVKLEKASDFVGKAALLTQKKQGLARKFYCFKLKSRTIPRQHDLLLQEAQEVGRVTSGSIAPSLNVPIGMGYIKTTIALVPGDTIQVRVRGVDVHAEIVERPFYKVR